MVGRGVGHRIVSCGHAPTALVTDFQIGICFGRGLTETEIDVGSGGNKIMRSAAVPRIAGLHIPAAEHADPGLGHTVVAAEIRRRVRNSADTEGHLGNRCR